MQVINSYPIPILRNQQLRYGEILIHFFFQAIKVVVLYELDIFQVYMHVNHIYIF